MGIKGPRKSGTAEIHPTEPIPTNTANGRCGASAVAVATAPPLQAVPRIIT